MVTVRIQRHAEDQVRNSRGTQKPIVPAPFSFHDHRHRYDEGMFKHILCPVDGSDPSLQALDVAARFAADQGASLTICTIVDPAKAAAMSYGDAAMAAACLDALETEGQTTIDDAAARVKNTINPRVCTVVGEHVMGILDACATNACDLIVIGSHGRTGISRALIGSVAEGVLRQAGVPVMVIRWTKPVLRQAQDDNGGTAQDDTGGAAQDDTGDAVSARASMA